MSVAVFEILIQTYIAHLYSQIKPLQIFFSFTGYKQNISEKHNLLKSKIAMLHAYVQRSNLE